MSVHDAVVLYVANSLHVIAYHARAEDFLAIEALVVCSCHDVVCLIITLQIYGYFYYHKNKSVFFFTFFTERCTFQPSCGNLNRILIQVVILHPHSIPTNYDRARFPASILGNNQLTHPLRWRTVLQLRDVVILWSVQKHNHVRFLLNGS